MPRYTKQNGDKVSNVRHELAWYIIPVKSNKTESQIISESYLIQPRVADYIELLECRLLKLGHELPKISITSKQK